MTIDRLGGLNPLDNIKNTQRTAAKSSIAPQADTISISDEAREMAEVYYLSEIAKETPDVRTFVFQTKAGREKAYVWYRKEGSFDWNAQECETTKWSHPHLDVNINKAIIKGLELGVTYEYQVGTEGIKSGIHTFETQDRDLENGDMIRILWTSDPQS